MQAFDKAELRKGEDGGTAHIMRCRDDAALDDDDFADTEQPQSEAAVIRSVLSVLVGDRIVESLERADQDGGVSKEHAREAAEKHDATSVPVGTGTCSRRVM